MSRVIISLLQKKNVAVLTLIRRKHVWTNENVVKSPFKDINIPNIPLTEYMWKNLDKWSNKTAVVCGITNREITFEQIFFKSQRLAVNLRNVFKLRDRDTVAVILPNMPEYPVALFGVLAAGGTVTTVNPVYTVYEIQRQLSISDCKLIIAHVDTVTAVKKTLQMSKQRLPIITVKLDKNLPEGTVCFEELCEDKHVDLSILKPIKRDLDDVAFLPFSSGTTGLPKGVQLTDKNIIANCEQQNTELKQYADTTESNQDTALCLSPMFHSYGLGVILLHKLSVGVRLVSLPKFEIQSFLNTLLAYKINLFYLAPATILFCGSKPEVTAKHFKFVTSVTCGGAPLPETDVNKFIDKVERDIIFQQAYGLTETSPLATITPAGYKNYTSVGFALPNMELRVVDEKFNNLGPNELGELVFKGPNIMKGYKDNTEANNEIFLDGKWLRSGDLAKINESGAVTIVDRLKELIKVKGYQVPPAELENVLKEHPDIYDAVVVGVSDSRAGQLPVACVILKDGVKTDRNNILDFVNERVAPYKKIKDIIFVDNIPRNPSGKILRRVVKETYVDKDN